MVPEIKDLRLKANEIIAGQLFIESSQRYRVMIPPRVGLTPYQRGDQLGGSARELMDELKIDCKNCEQCFFCRRTGLMLS